MDLNSEEEDTDETKVEKGVNENGSSTTGLKVPKLHAP